MVIAVLAIGPLLLLLACASTSRQTPPEQTDSDQARVAELEIGVDGLVFQVKAQAVEHEKGFVVDVEVEVVSSDGRTYRLPDIPLRRASKYLRELESGAVAGLVGCSGPVSHGGVFEVVTSEKTATFRPRLAPTVEPAFLAGTSMRVGIGLWDIRDPDDTRLQPAIATVELQVDASSVPRLRLRPGVDEDLRRACSWDSDAPRSSGPSTNQ
jgi:hypothetical protein